MAKTKRAALNLRVSTDGQSVENQRLALQAVILHHAARLPSTTIVSLPTWSC